LTALLHRLFKAMQARRGKAQPNKWALAIGPRGPDRARMRTHPTIKDTMLYVYVKDTQEQNITYTRQYPSSLKK
jgi:hypothetical protein